MENMGGRAAWTNSSANNKVNPLRSPRAASSSLSVDAPEFVPQVKKSPDPFEMQHQQQQNYNNYHQHPQMHPAGVNHIPQQQQQQQQHHQHHNQHHYQGGGRGGRGGGGSSVQNRLQMHQNPQQQQQQQQQQLEFNGDSYQNNESTQQCSDKESKALDFLTEVIKQLTGNPGMFEDIQGNMTELFFDLNQSNFVISNSVEMIFEQSVDEQNFRYMGARLCRLLDSVDSRSDNLFRQLLCLKMNDHQSQLLKFMQQNEKRKVRGTCLFLAELFMQMQNDGHRITQIASCIVSAMFLLLESGGPENVKCVCQALKLCGYELELDCPRDMSQIISNLQCLENTLDVSTTRLLNSVIDLKSKRWGRNELEPVVMAPINSTFHQDYNDAPVFYGPDGQVITDEESSFLLSNIPSYPNVNYDDFDDNDSDELADIEPEMDLEIQMAFKEFVKSAKNKQLQ